MSRPDDALVVELAGSCAGHLWLRDGLMRFQYDSAYLNSDNPRVLSLSLPLQERAFSHKTSQPFFEGLLPEQEVRLRVARLLGLSSANTFALLREIGADCAGAVRVIDSLHAGLTTEAMEPRWLEEAELAALISDPVGHPLGLDRSGELRMSLAGAQHKLPVVIDPESDRVGLPRGGAPSTHILKPSSLDYPGVAVNEAICMRAVAGVGLQAAEVSLRGVGGEPVLVVARFDRELTGGGVRRVAQEDFAQALGVSPERKYEVEGGPGVAACAKLLRERSSAPVLDVPRFLDALLASFLLGNADAHAKNFALLVDDGGRYLAPLYDIVSTAAYSALSTRFAMSLGGAREPRDLRSSALRKLAEDLQVSMRLLGERAARLAVELPAAVSLQIEQLDTLGRVDERTSAIADIANTRAAILVRALDGA